MLLCFRILLFFFGSMNWYLNATLVFVISPNNNEVNFDSRFTLAFFFIFGCMSFGRKFGIYLLGEYMAVNIL